MLRAVALLSLALAACFTKPERIDGTPDGMIDGATPDAPDNCNMPMCMSAGGKCKEGACEIDGKANMPAMCPDGMPCRVLCDKPDECQYVLCGNASTCDVHCVDANACTRGVDCGESATCTITCSGMGACLGYQSFPSIGCRDSTCSVTCNGNDTCKNGISTDPGGSCVAHCCGNNSCQSGTDACDTDNTCN